MADNSSVVLVRAILAAADYLPVLLKEDFGVLCVNKSTKERRTMPFKALYLNNNSFWLQKGAWEFFLSGEDFIALKDKAALKGVKYHPAETQTAPEAAPVLETLPGEEAAAAAEKEAAIEGFGEGYALFAAMPEEERVKHLNEGKTRLDKLIVQRPQKRDTVTAALVDTSRDAALINHATILDAMHLADDEAKKYSQNLVDSTRNMVKSSSQLISPDIFNDELMNTLVSKSNGTVIQHMTRVFLNGLVFLSYYNDLVSRSSIAGKLRLSFDREYKQFYCALMPQVPPELMIADRVFMGGMRPIPERDFYNWATGFLIHDIGKAPAVEYHEGEAAYNRDIVVEHVKLGYSSVMNKTNYPRDAALITGYHHEYYGDPGGYGFFRFYQEEYKKANPNVRQNYCITYDLDDILECKALAYFPAKVLEIIDVYDSVTDPNRKYRKAMSPGEALAMMRDEFIEKHRKLDLVLFDIFARFVRERLSP
jgi:hypothetical protein